MTDDKKRRVSHACKHKFVNPLNGNDSGDDMQLKCAWCRQVFQNAGELQAEYERLHIAYKMVPVVEYLKNDPNQPGWDPTKREENGDCTRYGFRIYSKRSSSQSNRIQYSSFRWGRWF